MASKLFSNIFRYSLRSGCRPKSCENIYFTRCLATHLETLADRRNEQENFDTLGTWDNRIDLPLLLQASIKHGKPIPKISVENVGSASVIGRRTTNEDRYR